MDFASALARAATGDAGASEATTAALYSALRALAHRQLRGSRVGTLNTTALVHEAWIKLVVGEASIQSRQHFFALAATAMRQIIVDHARRRGTLKRRVDGTFAVADLSTIGVDPKVAELLAIDRVLDRLAAFDVRLARVVEWRFFGGLAEEEIAAALDVDVRTVRRDWRKARAFLISEIARE
jgi:RNA polymerase sigma factor (TIGR02999 family)